MIEGTDFISVSTEDVARAERFYGETLGLPRSEGDTDFPGFDLGDVTLLIVDPDRIGTTFAPNRSGFALRVADVAGARRELEAKGVEFFGGVVDNGVRKMAFFADPDGNSVVLHRRNG